MRKNTENVNNKTEKVSNVHKNSDRDNSVEKWNCKKKTNLVVYSTLDRLSKDTIHNTILR